MVGKKIRGFEIYFVNFLLLHHLSSFVEGLRLTDTFYITKRYTQPRYTFYITITSYTSQVHFIGHHDVIEYPGTFFKSPCCNRISRYTLYVTMTSYTTQVYFLYLTLYTTQEHFLRHHGVIEYLGTLYTSPWRHIYILLRYTYTTPWRHKLPKYVIWAPRDLRLKEPVQ